MPPIPHTALGRVVEVAVREPPARRGKHSARALVCSGKKVGIRREIAAPFLRTCTAIISTSALRNSALSLGSDRDVGDKGGERLVVRLDLGRGRRLTRSVDT